MYFSSSELFDLSDPEAQAIAEIPHGFEVGSMVEVPMAQGLPRYGVIKWIGTLPTVKDKLLVAGLELVKTEVLCFSPLNPTNNFYSPVFILHF